MTREEIIKGLEQFIADFKPFCGNKSDWQRVDDALVLLKTQEPCEDAVSRKDVINVLQSPCDMRYVNGNWHPCIGDYIEAITNLSAVAPKAQEPRVLDLSEIPEHDGAVFIEYKSGDEDWALYIDEMQHSVVTTAGILLKKDYGIEWRAWTGRPTAEQRWQT